MTFANHSNIVRGLLRSKKILDYASDTPCNIIQTLENDAGAAEQFVTQIQAGEVPTIIENLPQEVVGIFSDVVGIAVQLPTAILGAAESVVTDAVDVFNDIEDGSIVQDLENLPGVVASDVVAGWGDLTDGIEAGWSEATNAIACFFGDCPQTDNGGGSCSAGPSTTNAYYGYTTTFDAAGAAYTSSLHAYESYTNAQAAYSSSVIEQEEAQEYSSEAAAYSSSLLAYEYYTSAEAAYSSALAAASSSTFQTATSASPIQRVTPSMTPPTARPSPARFSNTRAPAGSVTTSTPSPQAAVGAAPACKSSELTTLRMCAIAALGVFALALWL